MTDVDYNRSSVVEHLIQLIEEADEAMNKDLRVKAIKSVQEIADLAMKADLQPITKIALAIETYGVYENLDLAKGLLGKLKTEVLNLTN